MPTGPANMTKLIFSLKISGFGIEDYIVFSVMCLLTCTGGLWYSAVGTRKKKVKDIQDYLLGGKDMSTFPVSMSLIASYVSGVTILGTPAEIYNYGTQYWLIIVAVTMSCFVVSIVYLPVFCTLRVSSSYEYLEMRFNRHVRACASILFLLDEVMFLPMVVYVPSLAFNQMTGFNVFAVGGVMVLICGVYTVLGGLKAVVWTDSAQTGVMFLGVICIAIAGTITAGGVREVINTCRRSGRLSISNWDLSPYERQTGWGAVVGGFIYWTCFNSVNQTMVQRYLAVPNKKNAIHALAIFCCGAILAISLCVWCGLIAYTTWVRDGCDPAGVPMVADRLLPAFVTYVRYVQNMPGLPGVFLAGVFGAGLSSLSAVLNASALVAVEDLMRGWLKLDLKPLLEGIIARVITTTLALVSVVMLYVVSKLGGVLGVATALSAIAASATCGVFTLGMACWWVGWRGALVGAVSGAVVAGTTALGSQAAAARGLVAPPIGVGNVCSNDTLLNPSRIDPETIFPLFRISYHWIAPLGFITTLVVGSIVGWIFDTKKDVRMDAELFTPCVWRFLPPEAIRGAGSSRRKRAVAEAAKSHRAPLVMSTDETEMREVTR